MVQTVSESVRAKEIRTRQHGETAVYLTVSMLSNNTLTYLQDNALTLNNNVIVTVTLVCLVTSIKLPIHKTKPQNETAYCLVHA